MEPLNLTTQNLLARNVELHLQIAQLELIILKMESEIATWKQVAIAANEKARKLEKS
jgi:hypothetical protein